MRDMINNKTIPDDEVIFYDGFVYIISRSYLSMNPTDNIHSIDAFCLCPEYDDPMSLKDIAEKYPNVIIVLHEDWRKGFVYRYGNYTKDEWALTGTTTGFA